MYVPLLQLISTPFVMSICCLVVKGWFETAFSVVYSLKPFQRHLSKRLQYDYVTIMSCLTLPVGCMPASRHPVLRTQHGPIGQPQQTSRSIKPLESFSELKIYQTRLNYLVNTTMLHFHNCFFMTLVVQLTVQFFSDLIQSC